MSDKSVVAHEALVLFLVCFCGCLILWSIDGLSRTGTRGLFFVCFAICCVYLALALRTQFRKDKAPDFLRQLSHTILEHNGICFTPGIEERHETAVLTIWYQNRYERPASAQIAIKASNGFLFTGRISETVALSFDCGPAGFGVVRMPLPIPAKYQGSVQRFDVGAAVNYPNGEPGEMLRFKEDSAVVGTAYMNRMAGEALTVAAAAARGFAISRPGFFEVRLPSDVAEAIPDDAPVEVEELWKLGDSATTIAELGVAEIAG
jgi:hypothetical protein